MECKYQLMECNKMQENVWKFKCLIHEMLGIPEAETTECYKMTLIKAPALRNILILSVNPFSYEKF